MGAELAIDTTALTKYYGLHRGVVDVDLDVVAGEVFGFLGPNGAGKSTTIHLLVGQLRPSSGSATVFGLDCWREREAVQRRIGFLPGELAMYERLTGGQMLDYLARLRGGVRRAALDDLVERFGVELGRPIGTLSLGNKQKLGLVQALMHEPELVVLDEPTLGLDPLMQREFHRLVGELRAEGRTVFLSSHTLSEVERVADRVGIIRDGVLVEVAEVARLKQLAVRSVELDLADAVDKFRLEGVQGVRRVDVDGRRVRVEVEGPLADLMKVAADHGVLDIHVQEADLEEIFLAYYRDDPKGAPSAGPGVTEARGAEPEAAEAEATEGRP